MLLTAVSRHRQSSVVNNLCRVRGVTFCDPPMSKMRSNPLIILPCTGRKRHRPDSRLMAHTLERGNLETVASEWCNRVRETVGTISAEALYQSRGFQEGLGAARASKARMMVLSAGLGLVPSGEKIPAYGLTVSKGAEDCVLDRVTPANSAKPEDWWSALSDRLDRSTLLTKVVADAPKSLTLICLSETYARMIRGDLDALSDHQISTLRIFGLNIAHHLPERMRPQVVPIDSRLDGPDSHLPGTRADFAGRALRYYVDLRLAGKVSGESAEADSEQIESNLSAWRRQTIPRRAAMSDDQVHEFIHDNWEDIGGRSTAALRLLRDSGFACEQGRFAKLFHGYVKERMSSLQGGRS